LENAEIVTDLLELESAEVYHAQNGLIALEMFKASENFFYDAILMDLRMPVMDGLEAAKKIRSTEREDSKLIPIIALTANAFDNDIKNSKEAGMDVHLVKPVDADALYKVLKIQIEKTKGGRSHD
jgi:CheY-like chemotaxis protein